MLKESGVDFIFVPILASSATRLAAQLWTGALRGKSLGVYLRFIYGIVSRSDQHHVAMRTSTLPPVMDNRDGIGSGLRQVLVAKKG